MTGVRKNLPGQISASILALGLASATLIYMTAGDEPDAAVGYQVINGVVQPIPASESKSYQRELRLYGGTMAVLADEFSNWFAGLWRGRNLAFTIAAMSIALAAAIHLVAKYAPPAPESGGTGKSDRPDAR